MAKNNVTRLFDNLFHTAKEVSKACQQSKLDSWNVEEDMAASLEARKSNRLDQKKENTSVEVTFNEMKKLYKSVVMAFTSCQVEVRHMKQKIKEAENQILKLKENVNGSKNSSKTFSDCPKKVLVTGMSSSGPSMTQSVDKDGQEKHLKRPAKEVPDHLARSNSLLASSSIFKEENENDALSPTENIQAEKEGSTLEGVSILDGKLSDIPESEVQEVESEIFKLSGNMNLGKNQDSKSPLDDEDGNVDKSFSQAWQQDVHNAEHAFMQDFPPHESEEFPEMIVLNPETDLKHQCDLCPEKFFTSRGRNFHRRKHLKSAKSNVEEVSGQIKAEPSTSAINENSHSCDKCDKRFTRFSDLRRHIVTHFKVGNTYRCVLCEKHYLRGHLLERHMREKHTDNKDDGQPELFTCKLCSKEFNSLIEMALHVKEDHEGVVLTDTVKEEENQEEGDTTEVKRHQKEYTEHLCKFCDKTFKRSHDLARHMIIHDVTINKKNGYYCKDCDQSYRSLRQFENHPCKSEGPKKQISGKDITSKMGKSFKKCPKCNKRFNGTSLHIHEISHYKSSSGYTCKKCQEICSNAAQFHSHVVKKHEVDSFNPEDWIDTPTTDIEEDAKKEEINRKKLIHKPGKCGVCGKLFFRSDSLRRHVRTAHSGRRPATFHCEECKNVYREKKNLILHIRAVHSKEKPYKCTRCDQAFIGQRHLHRHMVKHTGIKKHMCEICGKRYVERSDVVKHVRMCHTPSEKKHLCTYCGKAFSNQAQRRVHERIHTGEKPYVCLFCTAAFSQSGPLKYHIRCHTGEKPFKCEECGKGFPTGTAARKHTKRCGSQDALKVIYQCEVCSKRFKRIDNLQKHLQVHEQGTPAPITLYQCGLCEEKFILEATLEQHLSTVHPAPPPELGEQVETIYMSDIQNADGEMVTVYITQ